MSSEKALVIIPTFLRELNDLTVTVEAVKSIRDTDYGTVDILLVDDGSPEPDYVDKLEEEIEQYGAELHRKEKNEGFSKTVNVGLRRCLQQGRDAVLMNADVEIRSHGWLQQWRSNTNAAVAGALLLYPNGLIQHGGVYFSALSRTFDHRWKYSPMDLPAAHERTNCPVTAAFQFIRHETLTTIGLYDEAFYMGWEDVDYCLRVFEAGMTCIYDPDVVAWHHEFMFRGRPSPKVQEWQAKSWMRLKAKWNHANLQELAPPI